MDISVGEDPTLGITIDKDLKISKELPLLGYKIKEYSDA